MAFPINLPFDLADDTTADADEVMANFNTMIVALNGLLDHQHLKAAAGLLLTQMARGATGTAMGAFAAGYGGTPGTGQPQVPLSDAGGFDVSGWFDNTTHRFTPQQAGIYRFSCGSKITDTTLGVYYAIKLRKNGAESRLASGQGTGESMGMSLSALLAANGTTDYFDVVWENDGQALDSFWFDGELVGLT